MVNLDKGNETIIFAWQGKTMIGKVVIDATQLIPDVSDGTVIGRLIDDKNQYFVIHNPCEIQYEIETPAQGSAELNWILKPYYYKHLLADDGVSYAAFAFKKDEVALSNIGGTTIHPDILAAYKELVGA
jgi:hypothetical protein